MPKSKVRVIEFIDEHDNVRGQVTDPFAVTLLIQNSELIHLMRNSRAFADVYKRTAEGVLQIPIHTITMDEQTIGDFIAFLNGEPIYRYKQDQYYTFRNRNIPYTQLRTNADIGDKIKTGLQFLAIPNKIIRKLFASRIVEMDEILEKVRTRREYFLRTTQYYRKKYKLGSPPLPILDRHQNYIELQNANNNYDLNYYPPEVREMADHEFLGWLLQGGLDTIDETGDYVKFKQKYSTWFLDWTMYPLRKYDPFNERYYPPETKGMTDDEFEAWLLVPENVSRLETFQKDFQDFVKNVNDERQYSHSSSYYGRGGTRVRRRQRKGRRTIRRR